MLAHLFSPALIAQPALAGTRAAATSPSTGASAELPLQPWADWVEPDFPFYSAMVYAERTEPVLLANNRTPRGIVLNLGGDVWACFDLDLLRIAAVWEGEVAKTFSNAALSYHGAWPSVKERRRHPLAANALWFANGIYPGWQIGTAPALHDPRPPGPDPLEVGRGPLPEKHGRFRALRLVHEGIQLEYTIGDATVEEQIACVPTDGARAVARRIRVSPTRKPLVLVVAVKPPAAKPATAPVAVTPADKSAHVAWLEHDDVWAVRISPRAETVEFTVTLGRADDGHPPALRLTRNSASSAWKSAPPASRWPQELTTHAVLSSAHEAYVVDDIPLPLDNPWRRNVRVADIQFLPDGRAAALTFDGDVWIVRGLQDELGPVRWRRFASGLHEPLSTVIRDGEMFVFDRNGIWRLRDTNDDGEADLHELFSHVFAQTFTANEYSNTMKLAPDGAFIIAKKDHHDPARGTLNGAVLRLSPDGRETTVLGWGFRQPFIGVDPVTGLVTASDQEGNYVPATPLYIVRDGTYHGFLAPSARKEDYPAPIDDPLTWLPRTGSASGVTQVWLRNARMGPLNDALIYVSYNRAELFVVRLNERHAKTQAAVVSLTRDLDFSPIGATVNPADGQLYLAGFKIYGSGAARTSGLARVRHTGKPSLLPREIVPMREGILLRFDVALAPDLAGSLANYAVERWNYRRTSAYGSPFYKLDGTKGQDRMHPSSVYLSRDGKSVFLGLPDMRSDVMQMQVGWQLATHDGTPFKNVAHFTPFVLGSFSPNAEGFGDVIVDLTPRPPPEPAPGEATATLEEGARLYQSLGCVACHTTTGTSQLGPTWRGLYGSRRQLSGNTNATADEDYLRESILDPAAKVIPGYEAPMPSYSGILNEQQIESLVLFIKSLH